MTVEQLINELSRYPKDMDIYITDLQMNIGDTVRAVFPTKGDDYFPCVFEDAEQCTLLIDTTFNTLNT